MITEKRQGKIASISAQVYYTVVIVLMISFVFLGYNGNSHTPPMAFVLGFIGMLISASVSIISGILWFFKIGIPFQKTTIRYHLTYVVLFIIITLVIMMYQYAAY